MNKAVRPERPPPFIATTGQDIVDLRAIQDFLIRRWKNIIATAAAVVSVTLIVLLIITPRYTATAEVFLQLRKEKVLGTEQLVSELNLESSNVDSQVSIIQSVNLLRRVVEKEKLVGDEEFGERQKGLLNFLFSFFKTADDTDEEEKSREDVPSDVLLAIDNLREAVHVERVNRTYVLAISVTSKDRAKAARLANAVANAFVVDQVEARYEAAKQASVWLSERIEELRQQVRKSEEDVANFRREHNLVATSAEAKTTILEQQLSELSEKLIMARADVAEKRAKYEQAKKVVEQGGNVQGIPDVVRSEAVAKLREQQAEVTRKEADIAAHFGSRHPTLINVRAERRDIDRSVTAEVQRILLNLKNDYEAAEAREKSLEESLNNVTGRTGIDNNVGVRLRELERINDANKTIFENFLSRSKIAEEHSSLEEREARVISPATKPTKPSFPKKGLMLAVAGVFGILLGIGGGLSLDLLNPGYNLATEIEDGLGQAVLASVPLLTNSELLIQGELLDPSIYLQRKPLSRYAESVRAIRIGVQIADMDCPPKVVLLTSSLASEGKSTLTRSIALSLAMSGQKILLIDCDLRHPSNSMFFQMGKAKGLVEVLAGEASFSDVAMEKEGFTLLPSGRGTGNAADLFGSESMKRLIDGLRSKYDCILIDSPPTELVVDAKVLNKIVDKVIFVVHWRRTPREIVARNIEVFVNEGTLAGIVLSKVDQSNTARYGAYAQYTGYYEKYYQG